MIRSAPAERLSGVRMGEVRASDLHGFFGDYGQAGGLPRVDAAEHIYYVLKSCALQYAAGDGAAVSALAVHCDAAIFF